LITLVSVGAMFAQSTLLRTSERALIDAV
jgi:hypothetical protein